jgi:hypothetical protein
MSSVGKILGSHGGAYSGTGLLSFYVILSLSADTNGSEESDPSTFRIKWHSSQAIVSKDTATWQQHTENQDVNGSRKCHDFMKMANLKMTNVQVHAKSHATHI